MVTKKQKELMLQLILFKAKNLDEEFPKKILITEQTWKSRKIPIEYLSRGDRKESEKLRRYYLTSPPQSTRV